MENDPMYREMDEDAYDMVAEYTKAKELIAAKKLLWKEEKQPERYELKLSDAFLCPVEEKCSFLREYMTFVDYVRQFLGEFGTDRLEHAIEVAIDNWNWKEKKS